jgi:oxazoline/thiazoline dehydrogenase
LSEFLFRTCRVRGRMRTEHEEISNRPYPGGGADYELEIYPVVQRVEGIESGIYYYHPLQQRLFHVAGANAGWKALLRDAASKARATELPDVLFCVTGRFQRLSYKYSSIAYAIMLKDLGALYQTFYLAATALELAPCAIGGGNADLFAAVSGLDYVVEPYIGEFMLSSRDEAEWIKFTPPQVAPPAR